MHSRRILPLVAATAIVGVFACSPDEALAPYGVRVVDVTADSTIATAFDGAWRISPDSAWGSALAECEAFPSPSGRWTTLEDSTTGVRLQVPGGLQRIQRGSEPRSPSHRIAQWGDLSRASFLRVGRVPGAGWLVLDERTGGPLRYSSKCFAHAGSWIVQVDRVTVTGSTGAYGRDTMHLAELHIAPDLPFMFQAWIAAATAARRDSLVGAVLRLEAIDSVPHPTHRVHQDTLLMWLRHLETRRPERERTLRPGR